jgi:hypothetical protein
MKMSTLFAYPDCLMSGRRPRRFGACADARPYRLRGGDPRQAVIATVRGWRRPITRTQMVPTVAVAAIGIMASGKLPVSAWIQSIR